MAHKEIKGGKGINEWLADRAHLKGQVKALADKTGLSTPSIYRICEKANNGDDVRVIGGKSPKIYEVKLLNGAV